MADTIVTHVNVEAGARALAPADFRYVDLWSGSGTEVGSGEKSALENIKRARKQARVVLEAVHAVQGGAKFTPGPYQRVNATVYALTESGGWRNGKPDMCNRFTAFVQSGVQCRSGEEEATAQLFAAAPDLFAALDEILDYSGGADSALDDPYVMDRARAALALTPTGTEGRDHG